MIKTCIFCGSNELTFRHLDGDYSIYCNGCHAMGPVGTDVDDATKKWNTIMKVVGSDIIDVEVEVAALQEVIGRKNEVIAMCKESLDEHRQVLIDYDCKLHQKNQQIGVLKTKINWSQVDKYDNLNDENKRLKYANSDLNDELARAERKANQWWTNIAGIITDGMWMIFFMLIAGVVIGLGIGVCL